MHGWRKDLGKIVFYAIVYFTFRKNTGENRNIYTRYIMVVREFYIKLYDSKIWDILLSEGFRKYSTNIILIW